MPSNEIKIRRNVHGIKQNSVMTILPIHFRFGTMYTYFIDYLNTSICLKGGLQLH